jgi:hypothetical protein
MPELTWTTALVWFGVIAGAVTLAGFLLDRFDGHRMADALTAISAHQVTLGQILESMERHAEARHLELKARPPRRA